MNLIWYLIFAPVAVYVIVAILFFFSLTIAEWRYIRCWRDWRDIAIGAAAWPAIMVFGAP